MYEKPERKSRENLTYDALQHCLYRVSSSHWNRLHGHPTLVLVNILISFGFALLISALWISQSRNEGVGYWVAMEWIALASFLLTFLYNHTNGMLWIAVATMGFGLMYTLNLEGLSYFRRSHSHARLGIVITALSSLAVGYIETHNLAWDYRIIVNSGAWVLLALLTIWTLLERGERTHKRIYRILVAVNFLNILCNALRIAATPTIAWLGPFNAAEMQAFILLETIVIKMSCDLGIAALILNRMQVRLNYLAHHDDLTEINNRRFFLEMAGRELADCQRKGESGSLIAYGYRSFQSHQRWPWTSSGGLCIVRFCTSGAWPSPPTRYFRATRR